MPYKEMCGSGTSKAPYPFEPLVSTLISGIIYILAV
jgi:hypothetical protein